MADLVGMCAAAGFDGIRTFIASGNVVFDSELGPEEVKRALEVRLESNLGKPVGVLVRNSDEMAAILAGNPFVDRPSKYTHVVFLDASPGPDALRMATGRSGEDMALGTREIFVFYPDGQGKSKLRIPAAATGTARNMNTVAKLTEMVSAP